MTASEQWGDQDLIDKLSRFGAVQGPDSYVGQLMTRGAKRLRELLGEPKTLSPKYVEALKEVGADPELIEWAEAHRKVEQPPVPSVCRTVAGPCGCKGQCPPKEEA